MSLARNRCRWENHVKTDLNNGVGVSTYVRCLGFWCSRVLHLRLITGELLVWMSDCQFLKKFTVSCTHLIRFLVGMSAILWTLVCSVVASSNFIRRDTEEVTIIFLLIIYEYYLHIYQMMFADSSGRAV